MLLETRTVSPKTARDGKLEISPDVALRLEALGAEFPVETSRGRGVGRATSMACTCARDAGAGHVHHFVESALFQSLPPSAEVQLELDEEHAAFVVRAVTE
jgi:hypothetical protein